MKVDYRIFEIEIYKTGSKYEYEVLAENGTIYFSSHANKKFDSEQEALDDAKKEIDDDLNH